MVTHIMALVVVGMMIREQEADKGIRPGSGFCTQPPASQPGQSHAMHGEGERERERERERDRESERGGFRLRAGMQAKRTSYRRTRRRFARQLHHLGCCQTLDPLAHPLRQLMLQQSVMASQIGKGSRN